MPIYVLHCGNLMLFHSSTGVMLYKYRLAQCYQASQWPLRFQVKVPFRVHSVESVIAGSIYFGFPAKKKKKNSDVLLFNIYGEKWLRRDINAPVKWLSAPYPLGVIKTHVDSLLLGEAMTCGHSVWWLLHVACITGPWSSSAEITDTSIDFSITLF